MASKAQIGGMLLEEAILYLLRSSGYKTITSAGGDPTLSSGRAGLEIRGRGSNHQIDAIADFLIHQPFSNPSRLLVEAKMTRNQTGINVARNAVGVLRDVSEYWVGNGQSRTTRNARTRFHYRYAIFSASGFSGRTQDYAFAQDIYLLPLRNNQHLAPLLDAIAPFAEHVAERVELGTLRRRIRARLQQGGNQMVGRVGAGDGHEDEFIREIERIGSALLAMLGNQFPVFLVPSPELGPRWITELEWRRPIQVRIYWDNRAWYLRSADDRERNLFSFDLPEQLFLKYEQGGMLTPEAAVRLKDEQLSHFQAFYIHEGRPLLLTFHLDDGWLESVKARLRWQGPEIRPA